MPETIRPADQPKSLLDLTRQISPFCSNDGQACASLPVTVDHRNVFPIRSAAFRDWLTAEFYKEHHTAPSQDAFRAALRTLEAQARYGDFAPQPVKHRLGFEGDTFFPSKLILDLANSTGDVLEITSQGWQIRNNLKTAFRQSPSTLPLPIPRPESQAPSLRPQVPSSQPLAPSPESQGPSPQPRVPSPEPLLPLRHLLNLRPDAWNRALAWLTSALRPTGPYPILVLHGPTNSGKSVLARALRTLIDPSSAPTHRLPARDRDLCQLALQNWILIFDQVHRVPTKISETLCALSSGDAIEINQPDLRDPLVVEVARPIILIAPHDETQRAWTPPRTLANRTITIHLDRIARPRPESAIWSEFNALHAQSLATLADALKTALARLRDIDLGNVPRFPDSATWTAAAAPSLGLKEADVISAFTEEKSMWTGGNPLREAIHAVLESTGSWTGEATDLLNELRTTVPLAALPSSARGLSQVLANVAGIHISRTRESNRRVLTVRKVSDASQKTASADPHRTLATLL